ncbi:putative DNA mismatch repair protein MSH4 [Monocercomonoides exilis]|uniref:putative DNA mismatch repair protein MSH4 n=1 Tax=Monocercomonoides exilis TaxID=2049356 RepID=UPI00355A3C08|nr:putative DNA mismatch repair protein MSH4 [Monocercomonoides exilis]|eukprot:MONOS_2206.1-p1 / transcript=MONOS_2206.1 / gene=MONOS_2206 / organism=Monocercomonoides_exilis_PA203 / gene_product=DNA mismatch repair protein MSH4 / transcript_product=DNA mismatch repair protein MSH4 / location=Mono_scaffold00044:10776-14437(-) / protein_length=950 / sequence_SO=supercontig / SO=protein_coding / is_pseudo=false
MKKNSQAFNSYIEQDYLSTTTENNENKSQTQSDDYSFLNEFTKKATSQDQQTDNKKFVAILENRTREIGLACFKSDFAHLSILEYPDSQTYSYTVLHLSQIEPSAIILPANAINLPLSLLLQRMFPEAIVSPMSRKFFNDVVGMHMLSQFTVDDAKTLEAYSASHYLSFGAAAAILKYIEIRTSIVFFPKSIKIHFIAPASHMLMDGRTIDVLEVVRSQGNGNCGNRRMDCGSYWSGHIQGDRPKEAATNKGSFPGQKRLGKIRKLVPSEGLSLFSFLNHTGTAMGSRLLRSSLIQPLTDLDTINSRLDAVGELLQFPQRMTTSPSETPSSTPISESSKSSSTFSSCFSFDTLLPSISAILSKIPDLDRIVSHFVYQHKKENMTLFQRGIRAFMHLDTILTLLPSLCELLKPFESSLICSIRANLSAPFFQEMKEKIQQIFVSSAFPTRGAWNGITQLAALIRPQVSSVIDVSRQVNEETMEDLRSLLLSYQSVYSLPSLRMHYGAKRGVYLSVSNEDVKNLPAIFEQRVKIGAKRTSCTTEEVASLGERCRRSLNDIIIHSYKIVRTLEDDVRANVGVLYRLTESIALLDMIVSFAIVASSYQGYVRPDLTYDGPIAVKQGRHPLRDIMLQSEYVPNNIFITDTRSILLLSGANMSGKTSILHLICSLSILAQVGSFIPADFASLRVFDHIFAHLGEKEGIESITRSSYGAVARNLLASSSIPSSASASSNSYRSSSANSSYRSSGSISSYLPNPSSPSSFLSEMRDIAFILSSYTSRSLIVIDELGRATNDREGFGIAWAVLEEFATKDEKEVREENDRMSSFSQFGKSVRDIPDSSDLSVGSTPQSCFSSASINPIVLFTTHYPELTNIEKYYSNIVNVHMEAIRLEESHPSTSSWNQSHLSDGSSGFAIQTHSGGTQTPMKLKFTYRLEYGPAQFADCGIDVCLK